MVTESELHRHGGFIDDAQEPAFNVGGFLVRRGWILVLAAALGVGCAYLQFLQTQPVYRSFGRLLVVESGPRVPLAGIEALQTEQSKQRFATDLFLIRSGRVVEPAIEILREERLPTLATVDPVAAVIAGLSVQQASLDADVLEIAFEGPYRDDCGKIVDAVMQSYRNYLGTTYQDVSEHTLKLIEKARNELHTQLQQKESDYRRFREQAPLLWGDDGEEGTNIHQARLAEIESARAAVLIEQSSIKAKLQTMQDAIANGSSREALLLMAEQLRSSVDRSPSGGESGSSVSRELFPLLLEEQMLLQNHGPDHPKVRAVRRKLEFTRNYLQQMSGDKSSVVPTQRPDLITIYVESLKQQLDVSEQKEQELTDLFEKEQEKAKQLSDYVVQDETFRSTIRRAQQMFDGVVAQLEQLAIVQDYGGYKTDVIKPAGIGTQISPDFVRMLVTGGVLGLVAGAGLAWLAEAADRSFRSPEEVGQVLGVRSVSHTPLIPLPRKRKLDREDLDPVLVAYHRPQSRAAEAFRAIRTSLYFRVQGQAHKVIQVTSPNSGDGKSTLAGNLAICIAKSGKSVILVDADFRQPLVHKLFSADGPDGLSRVIRGKAELVDAIQQTQVENLSVLPCGSRPSNPSELLTSSRFAELLEILRDKYEYVLVDTPPLLAVTDPSTVASRVDGVLLTLRMRKHIRTQAIRATDMLSALGAEVLGVVINAVDPKRGAYGYGAYGGYRYGYGGYTYGGYMYGAYEDRAYYAEHQEPLGQEAVESH